MIQIRSGPGIVLGDHRILAPGRFRWARALGWMIALFFGCVMVYGISMQTMQGVVPKSQPALRLIAQTALAAMTAGVYALLVCWGERRWPSELALRPAFMETLIGITIGALLFGATMAILVGFGIYQVSSTGPVAAWGALGKAVEAGVIEELIVRGIMLRLLWRAFGPAPAFAISALAFGGGHLFNSGSSAFAAICIMLEAGIMLGAFYALTGRLWMSIGVHAAWNFTQGYIFGAAVSGSSLGASIARSTANSDMPFWFTGGEFGPEASLPALLVCSALGLTLLWRAWAMGRLLREPVQ